VSDRILFVDDDENVLEGYMRLLRDEFRDEFDVDTAQGMSEAAAAIHLFGPYAVIISDIRMPGTNSAEPLAQMHQLVPGTVHVLLTDYKYIDQAIDAVNKGSIFRYLTKPCQKAELVDAVRLGIVYFHAKAEKQQTIKQVKEIELRAAVLNGLLQSCNSR